MSQEQIPDELQGVLHELGILSREELSAALFEAEQQSLSIWKHLRQTNRLTQKQADTLDMCQKGYIPVKVAKITLGMDKKVLPKVETKTVPATTQEPVVPKATKQNPPSRNVKTPSNVSQTNPTVGQKTARDFSSYLNTPEKHAPIEEVADAQQEPTQQPVASSQPAAPEPKGVEKGESSTDWPTQNARVIVDENLNNDTGEEELQDDENLEESSSEVVPFKIRREAPTQPKTLSKEEHNSFDTTQQGHGQRPRNPGAETQRIRHTEIEAQKFFPPRKNRGSHEQASSGSSASNSPSRSGNNKQRSDLSYLVGRKISKFHLSTQLGKGSAGTVFLAHHAALNMPVAIKILDPNLAKHYPELINRFMQEASSAARINHPNVIRVLDCDFVDGFYIIVMEYVDGISLSELVQMNGALSEDRGLKYILSVAEGLEAAYQVGIVHRDIKPANILITKTKQVRIADMGLARAITDNNLSETAQGVGLGTPQYFPPEQARDAANVDHRSDIYALGVTLYVVLTGELPFKAKTLSQLIQQHENEYAVPVNVVNPGITQRTTNLVITMMQKHPNDRYQSYETLIQALQSCIVECQTRSEDIGAGTSRSSFSMLNKLGNLFNRKT